MEVSPLLASSPLPSLASRRDELLRSIAAIADCRPGSLVESYRKCGKPNCRCAAQDHPGHGPVWQLTTKVEGKTRTRRVTPDELDTVRAQTAEYRRLRSLYRELLDVSEQLCEARLQPCGPPADATDPGNKKPSRRPLPPPSRPKSKSS